MPPGLVVRLDGLVHGKYCPVNSGPSEQFTHPSYLLEALNSKLETKNDNATFPSPAGSSGGLWYLPS